jgi:hypothetical protein
MNFPFRPEVGLTDAGSIRVHFKPAPPLRSAYGHERVLAATIYDLAAELERRCEAIGVPWVISPEPFRARLDLELGEHDESEPAAELVAATLSDLGLS